MKKIVLTITVLFLSIVALAQDVEEIVKKRDLALRGDTSFGQYEMQIESPRFKRNLKFKVWAKGTDKSFILITYPKKDKGITFLRIKTDMWQYIPRIERAIKIPPSMMLQSWMGSDFTNDDLAKESSIVNDYTHRLIKGTEQAYIIESIPHEEAAVVWGKIIQEIDKTNYLPLKDEFYDEDNTKVREIIYQDVKKTGKRFYPMRFIILPTTEEKQGHKTTILITEIKLNEPLKDDIFTMRALTNYSK